MIEELLQEIDAFLAEIAHQSLVDTNKVTDHLLDLRSIVAREREAVGV